MRSVVSILLILMSDEKRVSRRRFLKYGGAGVVVVGVAAAGAYYYATTPTGPSTTTSMAATTAAPATTVVAPKTFVYSALGAHWMDTPNEAGGDPNFAGVISGPIQLMYEQLFGYDPIKWKSGVFEAIPWLAESMTKSDDGLVYTIKLRKGIKFHSGNMMTADDVVYSYWRAILWTAPLDITGIPQDSLWPELMNMTKVEKVDDYTVKMTLDHPDVLWPERLCAEGRESPVMDSKLIKANVKNNDEGYQWLWNPKGWGDAGSGPYMAKSMVSMQRHEMIRFPDYWGGPPELNLPKPKMDAILVLPVEEDADARMKVIRGELDLITDLTPDTYKWLLGQPNLIGVSGPTPCYFTFNQKCLEGPCRDWRVRKAFKMAISYDKYAKDIMGGTAVVTETAYAEGMPGWEKNAHYFPGGDADGANALLNEVANDPALPKAFRDEVATKQSGPIPNYRFTIEIDSRPTPRYGMDFIAFSLQLADDFAKIGVNLNITVQTPATYYDKIWDMKGNPRLMWLHASGSMTRVEPASTEMYCYHLKPEGPRWFGLDNTTQAPPYAPVFDQKGNPVKAGTPGAITLYDYADSAYKQTLATVDPTVRGQMWEDYMRWIIEYGCTVTVVNTRSRDILSNKIVNYVSSGPDRGIWPGIFFMDKQT